MKIAHIATYPPRECGIGTFTKNFYNSILKSSANKESGREGFIVAINDNDHHYEYPQEVKLTIKQDTFQDYLKAAEFINKSGANLCIVQHEFDIFGGESGIYIIPLLYRLNIPIVITLHTVLTNPSYSQKAIVEKMGEMADKIVVMSYRAIGYLIDVYKIPKQKIALIEYGVPDIHFNPVEVKKELNLENKRVILTSGLLGRSKGIEIVIRALPQVVEGHPDVVYIVLGKTHPHVLLHSGEEYRTYLTGLVKELQLEKHVLFVDEFADQQNLFKYLYACDIYVTPYLNEAQITSGALSYAVGVGAAVISTPYWHASDLLSNGMGRLFDFRDSQGLASLLLDILKNPKKLKRMRQRAGEYGKKIIWSKAADKYYLLSAIILKKTQRTKKTGEPLLGFEMLPVFSLAHIHRLTNDTGIIQQARFGTPYLKEGYCLDDNAHALLMALMTRRQMEDNHVTELATTYLSFMLYMQNSDGTFRSLLTFSQNFINETVSEDTFGRAVWTLGYLLNHAPGDAFYQTGKMMFHAASPHFEKLNSVGGIANTIIGIAYYLKNTPDDESMRGRFTKLAHVLVKHYQDNNADPWSWFESFSTHESAILPLALLHAAEILKDEEVTHAAFDSMNVLTEHTFKENYFSIIGNEKWYTKDQERPIFAQQPIDAMSMVLMYHRAFSMTRKNEYFHKMGMSFLWFLGENDLRMSLYDHETKGCYDGFGSYGVNRNQGAESSLAWLISHLTVMQAFDQLNEST